MLVLGELFEKKATTTKHFGLIVIPVRHPLSLFLGPSPALSEPLMAEANSGAVPVFGEYSSGMTPVPDMASSVSGRLFFV